MFNYLFMQPYIFNLIYDAWVWLKNPRITWLFISLCSCKDIYADCVQTSYIAFELSFISYYVSICVILMQNRSKMMQLYDAET